jgi:hypothetical protein
VRSGVVAGEEAASEEASFTAFTHAGNSRSRHPDENMALQRGCVAPRFRAGAARVMRPVTTLSFVGGARHRSAASRCSNWTWRARSWTRCAACPRDWRRVDAVAAAEVMIAGGRIPAALQLLRGAGFERVEVDAGVLVALGAPRSCVMVYAQRTQADIKMSV